MLGVHIGPLEAGAEAAEEGTQLLHHVLSGMSINHVLDTVRVHVAQVLQRDHVTQLCRQGHGPSGVLPRYFGPAPKEGLSLTQVRHPLHPTADFLVTTLHFGQLTVRRLLAKTHGLFLKSLLYCF